MENLTQDWRQKAAAAANTPDSEAIEKAFMDQAYTFVANKAGDLMADPYRLGFEVVYKNDDNTRMVGIFAFRIDDELLYVPCFFLNGEIKGTDLLYRHDSKKFVPLNRDWVSFLLEKAETGEGKGIDKDHRRKMPTNVNLRELASPPAHTQRGYSKYASENGAPELNTEFMDKMAGEKVEQPRPLLQEFLRENGMEAFDKLAAWIQSSPEFTKALYDNVEEQEFMIDDLDYTQKTASAPTGSLRLFTGELPSDGIKSASEAESFFKRGFALLDDRSRDLSPVTQDDSEQFTGICEAGVYDIIMGDGSLSEAFVANGEMTYFPVGDCSMYCSDEPCGFEDAENDSIVVLTKSRESGRCSEVMGIQKQDFQTALKESSILKQSMTRGKVYRVLDTKTGSLTEPFYCAGSKTRNGIKCYEVCTSYEDPWTLKVNPDYEGFDLKAKVIGDNNRFVEVAADVEDCEHSPGQKRINPKRVQNVGNMKHLLMRIRDEGYKRASVVRTTEEFYRIDTGSKYLANEVGFKSACVALSKDLAVHADTALAIMDKAAAEGRCDFFLQPTGEKAASVIRVMDEPEFETEYDNAFGVDIDPAQKYVLDTEEDFEEVPEPHIGDAMDPRYPDGMPGGESIPRDVLDNAPPEALAQYAKMHNLPNVFEHGLVGSLVKTYDSVAMLDKYVPEIESALDSIGRILFLFWWKPGDFQEAYGVDDMVNLENELVSNFKSIGELTLDLLKRSQRNIRGTPPLPT